MKAISMVAIVSSMPVTSLFIHVCQIKVSKERKRCGRGKSEERKEEGRERATLLGKSLKSRSFGEMITTILSFFFCLFNYFVITLIPSVRIISRQSKLYARRWGHNGE